MTWFEDEYRRRMKAMGYEPTMDGMDDQDVRDALEAMDRRNARQQDEWQYPRYKPVDPGLQARILRMFGQPYDPKYIPKEEKHYIGGWDNGDDEGSNPQLRPSPQRSEEQSPVKPFDPWKTVWKLDWGPEGSPADRPQTPESLPGSYTGTGVLPHNNGMVNAMANPSSLAATPLGLAKSGLGNAKPGDLVVGRDGVLRPYAEENALSRAVDRLTARVLEPRPEQDGASFPGYGAGNGPGVTNSATGFQPMSSNTGGKSYLPDPNLQVPGPKPPDLKFPNPLTERLKTSGSMIPSEKLFGFITSYEKFEDKPYNPTKNDNDSPTIGFGHKVRPGEDFSNGISLEEARKVLRKDVQEHADAINQWAAENNIKLTQQQFDALVSLRFNLGSLEGAPKLRSLIISGNATEEQIRKEMEDIITDGKERQPGLWRRRKDEGDMFFYNDYRRKYPKPPKDLFPDFPDDE